MKRFENTVTIERPAEDVFAFLADFENVPTWNYAIEETTKTSSGPVGVGTIYRQTRSIPRRSEEGFEVTPTVAHPPKVMTHRPEGRAGPRSSRSRAGRPPPPRISRPAPFRAAFNAPCA